MREIGPRVASHDEIDSIDLLCQFQIFLVAQMAHDGLARSIRPVHTMFDGDTIFALATGKPPKKGKGADPSVVGSAAAEVLAQAVVRAVQQAESLGGVPAACDLKS